MEMFTPIVCTLVYFLVIFIRNTLRGRVAEEIEKRDLCGQCFCITGGSRGIGYCVAKTIVRWGGSVILGVRDVQYVQRKLKLDLTQVEMRHVEIYELNLASFASVRSFAKLVSCNEQRKLNGLINSAHHSGLSSLHVTEDGIEYSYQVNYLSHFLLTMLLLPALNRVGEIGSTSPSRIIHVGSRTYTFGSLQRNAYNSKERNIATYDPNCIYPDTKLMQFVISKEFARRCACSNFNVSSDYVHPGGLVRTAAGWCRGHEFSLMHRFEPTLMWLAGAWWHASCWKQCHHKHFISCGLTNYVMCMCRHGCGCGSSIHHAASFPPPRHCALLSSYRFIDSASRSDPSSASPAGVCSRGAVLRHNIRSERCRGPLFLCG
jgi:NAD(P)-dependent dehydrogenase (short-subunit alcohol dehydrogenase family)